MNTKIKMTSAFWDALQTDVRRSHAFAAERVAFAFGRRAHATGGDIVVLSSFAPVDDTDYEDDPRVGARIGALAISKGLRGAAALRAATFHAHLHEHEGRPRFSPTDMRELPDVMAPFGHIVRGQPHGLLLLSIDGCVALIWDPESHTPTLVTDVTIVGMPMRILRGVPS